MITRVKFTYQKVKSVSDKQSYAIRYRDTEQIDIDIIQPYV